jgi:hypothetical protein
MKTRTRTNLLYALAFAAAVAGFPGRAHAQMPVIDIASFAQAVENVKLGVKAELDRLHQINIALNQFEQEARALKNLDNLEVVKLMSNVKKDIEQFQQYRDEIVKFRGTVEDAAQHFRDNFAAAAEDLKHGKFDALRKATRALSKDREEAFREAENLGSRLVESLDRVEHYQQQIEKVEGPQELAKVMAAQMNTLILSFSQSIENQRKQDKVRNQEALLAHDDATRAAEIDDAERRSKEQADISARAPKYAR